MEIAVSSPWFSLRPPDIVASEIAEVKRFPVWEVVAEAEHHMPGNSEIFLDIIERYGIEIQVHAPISDVNLGSLSPPMRGKAFSFIWETLEVANSLGVPVVTVHPGHISPIGFYAREKVVEASKKAMRDLDKINRAYDLVIALENMPPLATTICKTPWEIEEHIVGTDIMFCLDVGHAHASGNLLDFLSSESLMSRLANVHVHDNHGKKDEHLVVGDGGNKGVKWDVVRNSLEKIGYGGRIVIESHNLEEALESLDRLEKMGW